MPLPHRWLKFNLIVLLGLLLGTAALHAEVRLAGVFGDHMVLQREMAVPVWGWADPGESVAVTLGSQSKQTTADASGKWMLKLDAMSAGGPFSLTASGSNKVTVSDVLVGEVWLCSGQSNMAMTVNRAKDFENEKQHANFPQIRHFKTNSHATPEPQADCSGSWSICTSDSVGGFSATAYCFGRKLYQELNVPIGLINSSWGGTDVAAWTSLPAQQAVDAIVPKLEAFDRTIAAFDPAQAKSTYEAALARWEKRAATAKKDGKPVPRRPQPVGDPRVNQNRPANLFNGMINPLIPYAIRGATWYQGERNSHSIADGVLYAAQLKALIGDWRSRWEQGDFQFLTVQLPNFHAPVDEPVQTTGWVMVRESEMQTLQLKNTGIAITTDVGEANDIHPKDKQTVGHRLALWALGTTYGQEIVYSGPLMSFSQYRTGTTNDAGKVTPGRVMVNFIHANGLKSSDGKPLRGFAVADEDRKFYPADAGIDKETGLLVLSSKKVHTPVAARYNWADNPDGNLVNGAGLPAAPFRTDRWDVSEEE
ncbi:MAG: sialate O-acetylesterase [Planctomycetales bacterium]|nr:sialate O-acetylesterase [Planctomycetales bacterium]